MAMRSQSGLKKTRSHRRTKTGWQRLVSVASTHKKINLAVWVSVAVFFLALFGWHRVWSTTSRMLPKSLAIQTGDSQLTQNLTQNIAKMIEKARQTNETRTHFLQRVQRLLASSDQIDEYGMRLGLDGVLQIHVLVHVPFVLLYTKGGESYVVSSAAHVIAKNVSKDNYVGLPVLSLPEAKLVWKSKALQKKTEPFTAPRLYTSTSSGRAGLLSLPWLIGQTKILYSLFPDLQCPCALSKVVWTEEAGFQVVLVFFETNNTNDVVWVLLGKDELVLKMKRMRTVLAQLAQKNLRPSEIDLDYTNKASLKIPEASVKP